MSRTTTIVETPCKRFLKWKTIKNEDEKITGGTFVYYDKDTEKNIEVALPFKFALLSDEMVTFKGYDEKNKRGVWANEVKDKEHEVILRCKEGQLMKFKLKDYKANKPEIESFGGKYTKSVYIAVQGDQGYEIWNLQISGAAGSGAVDTDNFTPEDRNDGWFNFSKFNKNKLFKFMLGVDEYTVKKKGSAKFTVPVFNLGEEISQEDGKQFDALDVEFKEYLKFYFNKPTEVTENEPVTENAVADPMED